MNTFYVYTTKDNSLEFIESESLPGFAAHEFKPEAMTFTGVAVEADDLNEAFQIYMNPACGFGEYTMTDEPQETFSRRQLANAQTALQASYQSADQKLQYLRVCMKLKAARFKMDEANRLMNEISQDLFKLHNNPEANSPELIFEKLASATIEKSIKYNGDTTQPG